MTTLIPKFEQNATGAVNRPISSKLAEIPSLGDFANISQLNTYAATLTNPINPAVSVGGGICTLTNALKSNVSVLAFGAVGDGTTDNLAAFQAALDQINTNGGGTLIIPPGNYLFKKPSSAQPILIVYSNTSIIIQKGATLLSQAIFGGFNSGLFTNAANAKNISISGQGQFKAADGITLTGTTTTTSTTINGLSSTTGLYVNMSVYGSGIPYGSYIVSIGSTSVVISAAATASGSVPISFNYTGTPFVAMYGVDQFYMGDGLRFLDVYGNSAGFAFKTSFASLTNFIIDDVYSGYETKSTASGQLYAGEDFLHFYGGCQFGVVSNVVGTSGDDFIAFNIEPTGAASWDLPISNINVSNIQGFSRWAQIFRLYCNSTSSSGSISYINMSNITGYANSLGGNTGSCGAAIEDFSLRTAIANINISNFSANCSNNGQDGIFISYVSDITVNNFEPLSPYAYSIHAANSGRVTFNNPKITSANRNTGGVQQIYLDTCTDICINGGSVLNGTSAGAQLANVTRGVMCNTTYIGNAGNGIALSGTTSHTRVMGNYFYGQSGAAIQEYNTANYNIITSNDASQNTAGGIITLGANTIKANNL